MVKVEIINNITCKINEFQKKYGSSRTFISSRMGISRQSLNALETSNNPTIQMLERLAYVLQCDIKDLYIVNIAEID